MVEHRAGELAHESEAAATVNKADIVLGKQLPKLGGSRRVGRIGAGVGTAINADIADLGRESVWSFEGPLLHLGLTMLTTVSHSLSLFSLHSSYGLERPQIVGLRARPNWGARGCLGAGFHRAGKHCMQVQFAPGPVCG